ncbi:MAG: Holliday junction branch migration protein RuvA [Lachnospiraceae bacterium]
MIALIEGTVVEKSEGEAIVMTAGGVGYRLMCSMNTLSSLPAAGDKCRLYTHLNVREDAMELYGFLQTEEREMFRRLIALFQDRGSQQRCKFWAVCPCPTCGWRS